MKFSSSLEEFQKALQKVLPAMPPKSTLPVLEHIRFTLEDNLLKLIATDQDITIMTTVTVIADEPGSVLVPGRKINEIIKALSGSADFRFVNNPENFEIELTTPKGKYKMKGLDPDDYLDLPELFDSSKPDPDEVNNGNIDTNNVAYFPDKELNRLCAKTVFAVSKDEFRPAMTGVLFQFRENYVNFVATDSYRLVRAVTRSEKPVFPQDFDIIIPKKCVELIKNADENPVMSFINSGTKITHSRFDYGNTVLISRVIEEKFPPYESVIPDSNPLQVTVDYKELIKGINRVSLFTNVVSKQIKLELKENILILKGDDEESGNQAREELQCEYSGEDFEIGFNFAYLEEAVKNIDASETKDDLIVLSFSESSKPALVTPKTEEENLLMLIMPVKI